MLNDPEKRRALTRWILGIVSACILLYLAVRHIANVATAVVWLENLVHPLLLGFVVALVLNVPMSAIEELFLSRLKLGKAKRAVAIILALLLVIGIFTGVAVLVIPELVSAVRLLIQIAYDWLEQLSTMESDEALSSLPIFQFVSNLNIDWNGIQTELETWIKTQSGNMANYMVGAVSTVAGSVFTAIVALTFGIYIAAEKETLKRQVCRLIHVWLPRSFGDRLIHVSAVCAGVFKSFIAGQTIEAFILGSLCMIGMAILRIPYAPMIGALVGVTALIPVIGAWVGALVGCIMILTESPLKAVIFLVFLVILQQIEGNVIYPRVVGSKVNLPAIWVLAAVTVGGNLMGAFGMLLGVPAASAAYALLKEATANREARSTEQPEAQNNA